MKFSFTGAKKKDYFFPWFHFCLRRTDMNKVQELINAYQDGILIALKKSNGSILYLDEIQEDNLIEEISNFIEDGDYESIC